MEAGETRGTEASSTGPSCGLGEEGRGRASREHAQRRATGPSPALPCHALCTARWPIRRPYRPLPFRPRDRFGPTFLGALSRRPIPCRFAVVIIEDYDNWVSATRGAEQLSSMHLEESRGTPSRCPPRGAPTAAETASDQRARFRAPQAARFREWVSGTMSFCKLSCIQICGWGTCHLPRALWLCSRPRPRGAWRLLDRDRRRRRPRSAELIG